MNLHTPFITLALLAASTAAQASGPATTGAISTPANRIVGTWSNVASTALCSGGNASVGRQTIVFSAGGTFLDNPRFPPGGTPIIVNGVAVFQQRSIGVGTWSYDPDTSIYTVDQRFDWYVSNVYNGYQTVHRTMLLSNDGNLGAGPVQSVRYAANNAIVAEICGSATATRL